MKTEGKKERTGCVIKILHETKYYINYPDVLIAESEQSVSHIDAINVSDM